MKNDSYLRMIFGLDNGGVEPADAWLHRLLFWLAAATILPWLIVLAVLATQ